MHNEHVASTAMIVMWVLMGAMAVVGLVFKRSAKRQKARNDAAQALQSQALDRAESSRPPLTA